MFDPPTHNRPFADKRDRVDMDGVPYWSDSGTKTLIEIIPESNNIPDFRNPPKYRVSPFHIVRVIKFEDSGIESTFNLHPPTYD